MKKQKQPGDNISLKTKKNEAPAILKWINTQSNLMDSLRYLIENEIKEHGIRNLQQHIPADRGFASENAQSLSSDKPEDSQLVHDAHMEDEIEESENEMDNLEEDDIDDEDIESWM